MTEIENPDGNPSPGGKPEKEASALQTSVGEIRVPEGVVISSDAPTPIDPNFHVSLPNFEGPLDLLLHLIKKHELDIIDLPMAFVTERYVEYMQLMDTLNLDVAAEYLVMAATLIHIKSKSLLPRPPEDQDDEEEDGLDPREELIRRLLAYQKYKNAAEELGARGVVGRDVFSRGIPVSKAEGPAPLAEVSVFKLIDIFQKILKRHEGKHAFEIDAERITIQERMGQITEMVRDRVRLPFEALFEGYATTYDLVVTFLALLEMAKMRLVGIFQAVADGPIYLEARVLTIEETDEEAVAAAFSYDAVSPPESMDAEARAPSPDPDDALSPPGSPSSEEVGASPEFEPATAVETASTDDSSAFARAEDEEELENATEGDKEPSPA
ncbi:MAG: segregation and condensation protein A [Polyangiales bacterium]|jgi:segregation and condensation protein A